MVMSSGCCPPVGWGRCRKRDAITRSRPQASACSVTSMKTLSSGAGTSRCLPELADLTSTLRHLLGWPAGDPFAEGEGGKLNGIVFRPSSAAWANRIPVAGTTPLAVHAARATEAYGRCDSRLGGCRQQRRQGGRRSARGRQCRARRRDGCQLQVIDTAYQAHRHKRLDSMAVYLIAWLP